MEKDNLDSVTQRKAINQMFLETERLKVKKKQVVVTETEDSEI